MKSYADQIIKKMKENFYPTIGWDFIFSLINESHRGSVLIGTAKVEEYLERLIISILPKVEKKYKDKLLNYPGPISSFSSKIELAFAFRLIDIQLYNSLNILRKIRNQAAHTSNHFDLKNLKEEIDSIGTFETNFEEVIKKFAFDNLEKMKKYQMEEAVKNAAGSQEMKNEILQEKFKTLTTDSAFLEQLIIWKLAYGLSFMCLKILAIINDCEIYKDKTQTWIEIIENKSNCA